MNKDEKNTLEKRLASLDGNERNRLYKRAAQMRKLAQTKNNTRPKRAYLVHEGDEEPEDLGIRQPKSSLHDWVLRLLSQDVVDAQTPESGLPHGTVIAIGPRSAQVSVDGRMISCLLSKELAETQQTDLAVGDFVEIAFRGEETAIVERVRPRTTKLSRPDPGKKAHERVIVANVDAVVVVASIVSPPLHPRVLDRYMIAIRRGGAQAIIAVNKLDLASPEQQAEELAKLQPYRGLDVPVVPVSAGTGEGLDVLRELLRGKLSAFVGHSGVGKSSLLNALNPELDLQVGAVSEGYGRGTHTTTRSTLWDIGESTRIIDTPGIRSFGLWNLTADELPWYFPEFFAVGACKFGNCTHTHEPQCTVKEAVEAGDVSSDRYDTYLRILETLR